MLAIASATSAYAKGATGTIASIDKKGDSITLVDGKTFVLPDGIEAETLKVGEKVTITYSTKASKLAASSIKPAN
jgi:PDZ domain-containing secreted protein